MKRAVIWTASVIGLVTASILIYRRVNKPKNNIQILGVIAELKDSALTLPKDAKKYEIFTLEELSQLKDAIKWNNENTKRLGYLIYTQSPQDQLLIKFTDRINSQK
jgi:hypothetical protein